MSSFKKITPLNLEYICFKARNIFYSKVFLLSFEIYFIFVIEKKSNNYRL